MVVLKHRNWRIIVENQITSLLHWLPNSNLHDCAHLHVGRAAENVFDTIKAHCMNAKKKVQLIYISKNLKILFYVREIKYF